jgi:hypothetical protein
VSLDTALIWGAIATQAGLVALLIWRRAYRRLPIFSFYVLWCVVSDSIGLLLSTRFPDQYSNFFQYEMPLDSALQFGVLVELAWSVLRPLQSSLPRWTVAWIAGLILVAGAAVWPIAGKTVMQGLPMQWHLILRLQQTFSILRILFFLVLAAGSQLLSLGWRDRELQVATGLGFYSLVSLATALLHAQMPKVAHYHKIDQVVAVSYFCTLVYWAVSFLQKEAPRQEFKPEMRNFLLTVSGAARTGRIALQDNRLHGNGPR